MRMGTEYIEQKSLEESKRGRCIQILLAHSLCTMARRGSRWEADLALVWSFHGGTGF